MEIPDVAQTRATGALTAALGEHKKTFLAIAIFTAVINLLILTPSLYMLQVYDRVLPSRNVMTLLMLSLIALSLYGLSGLLDYLRSMIIIRLSNRFDLQLNTRVYQAACTHARHSGVDAQASRALSDLTTLRQFLTGNALFAFFDAPWFPLYLLVIFLFNRWMGLFALAGASLLIALAFLNQRLTRQPLAQASQAAMQSRIDAQTALRSSETLHAMGMLPALQARWYAIHLTFLRQQSLASERAALISALTKAVRLALQSAALGLGGWLTIAGDITPGMMIAGSILMGRVLAPIEQVIAAWKPWRGALAAWRRLEQLLKAHPAPPPRLSLPPPTGVLTVERISTAVLNAAGVPVLQQISFALQPGDVLGIVGPSAAGKSTLARLLVGGGELQEGVIRLDDADLHQWDKTALGRYIGYLPQNIDLLPGSVADNIARFQRADDETIVRAARLAGVHELILRLPQGYDTVIGPGNHSLSGGEKQRIGLARALYGDPVLIVLDEPGASLDEAGERALLQTLHQLRRQQKTVLVITHRAAQLAATTKLLVLTAGKCQAFGPTQTVLTQLSQLQARPGRPPAPAAPAPVPADESAVTTAAHAEVN